ncbi:iron complex transport system substrate-binding protein [Desulfosarcina sp. BuS5]|uniref:ABC transporter substrate-binding protein n=1 Tax=Desulfosarcina sp. BuS5 TaxID=933262 RepID=UPI00054F528E|nr:cobalamin-binding protein [Desulfosarcina sp. BuS5]WDN90403.1 iron complex transport system substrate-binding protein [Desulfosarcina sp. BuS5]
MKILVFCGFIFFLAIFPLSGAGFELKTVIDQVSRQVVVPAAPQRVIALAPSITEIIFALEQENRLKGVTAYSDFPKKALKLPKVGSYVYLDLERIVSLKPDLCIAIKDGNPKEAVDKLESIGIPVYAVNPKNIETVINTVVEIGGLLNASKKADALAKNMRHRIKRVEALIAKTDLRPGIFFQIGIAPIVSVGTDTFIHELIIKAGGRNLAEGPVSYPRFSREQVLALAPDIIIITSMARSVVFEQVKAEWNKWPNMPAVKTGRIFLEDSNLFDRPTPRLVDGLELLLKLIHPELINEANKCL